LENRLEFTNFHVGNLISRLTHEHFCGILGS
jgi:hypothetical protein